MVGRTPDFVIFDEGDALSLIRKILKGRRDDMEGLKPAAALQAVSRIKNGVLDLEALTSSVRNEERGVAAAFEEYERALRRNNAFDFDDLIEKTVRLFRERPDVLARYQEKFRFLLVDEYQDLNPKQYELVRLLAGSHRNLSVVGDDHQMIYGWRYATVETFLSFESDWPGGAGRAP